MADEEQVQSGTPQTGVVADVILQAIFGLSGILMKAQEEFILISFNSMQRTCYTGSKLGRDFLKTHKDVISQFLQHCSKDEEENNSKNCEEAVKSCDQNTDDTTSSTTVHGVSESDQQRGNTSNERQIEQGERTQGDLGSEDGTHAVGEENTSEVISNVATLGSVEKTDERNDQTIDKPNTKEVTNSSVNDIHGNRAVSYNSQNGKAMIREKNFLSDQTNAQSKESTCPQNCAKVTKQCTKNKLSCDQSILNKYGVTERQGRCMYLPEFLTDEAEDYGVSKSGIFMDQEDRESMFGDLSRFISVKPLKCLIKERNGHIGRLFNRNMDDQEIELEDENGAEEFSYKIVRGAQSNSNSSISPYTEKESIVFGGKETSPYCVETKATGQIESTERLGLDSVEVKSEKICRTNSIKQKKDKAKNLEFKRLDRVGEEEFSYAEIHVKTPSKIECNSKGKVHDEEEIKVENIKKEYIVNSEDDYVDVCGEVTENSKNNTVHPIMLNKTHQHECTAYSVLSSSDTLGTKSNFTNDFQVDISSEMMEGFTQQNLVTPLMLGGATVTSQSEISVQGIGGLNNTIDVKQEVIEMLPLPDLEHNQKTPKVFPISMINVKDFLTERKTPRHSYSEKQRKFFDDDDDNENSVCSFCGSHFPNDYSLQLHISYVHHDGRKLSITRPGERKKSHINLPKHLSKYWDSNRCKICNKAFPTVAKLIMHKRMLHSKNNERPKENDKMAENYSKPPLHCQNCKRTFVNEFGLKTHQRACNKKRQSLNDVKENTEGIEVFWKNHSDTQIGDSDNHTDAQIGDSDNHTDTQIGDSDNHTDTQIGDSDNNIEIKAKPTQESDQSSSCSEEICVDDISDTEVINSSEISLKCSECSVTFSNRSKLKSHMERIHNVDIFCNICKKLLVYDNEETIPSCTCVNETHDSTIKQKDSNSRKRKFHVDVKCPFCCEQFSNFAVLKQHTYICPKNIDPDGVLDTTKLAKRSRKPVHTIRSDFTDDEHHEIESGENEYEGKVEGLECNECGKIYKTERILKDHQKHNHGNRLIQNGYKCYVCGKMFSKEISLNAHMHICSNRSNTKSGHMTRSTSKSKGVNINN